MQFEAKKRALNAAQDARNLVVQAQEVSALNPLLAGGKIKELALNAAKIARENAEIAWQLADDVDSVRADLEKLRGQLAGYIKG